MKPDLEDPFFSFPGRRSSQPDMLPQQTIYQRHGGPEFVDGGGESDNAGDGGDDPTKEDQRDDHPFAISVRVTELGLSGEAVKVRVKVLGGTYATGNGDPFTVTGGDYPAVVVDEEQTRAGKWRFNALLFVPTEECLSTDDGAVKATTGRYVRAVTGGYVGFTNGAPAAFPNLVVNPATSTSGFFVHLGSWTGRFAEQDVGGVPTRENRLTVAQLVSDDVVLEADADADDAAPRTFFARGAGANVIVSAGAINNIVVAETTISSPSDGTKIYIEADVDEEGDTTAVTVSSGSTVPADTETKGHKLLAAVAVSGGAATATPLGWNFSEMQKCGPTTYLWGGFGGA